MIKRGVISKAKNRNASIKKLYLLLVAVLFFSCSYEPFLKPQVNFTDLLFYFEKLQSPQLSPADSADFNSHRRYYFLQHAFKRMDFQRCDFRNRIFSENRHNCPLFASKELNADNIQPPLDFADLKKIKTLNLTQTLLNSNQSSAVVYDYFFAATRDKNEKKILQMNKDYIASNVLKSLQIIWPFKVEPATNPAKTEVKILLWPYSPVSKSDAQQQNLNLALLLEAAHALKQKCLNFQKTIWFFYEDQLSLENFLKDLALTEQAIGITLPRWLNLTSNFKGNPFAKVQEFTASPAKHSSIPAWSSSDQEKKSFLSQVNQLETYLYRQMCR